MAGHTAGRSTRRFKQLRKQIRATETRCYRCGMPIDWTIPYRDPDSGIINPDSGTVEHIQALSKNPLLAEDRGNLGASHWSCNLRAGDRDEQPTLGTAHREW
jgi:5-methylcytosine-specific restriction endonuclease McrA